MAINQVATTILPIPRCVPRPRPTSSTIHPLKLLKYMISLSSLLSIFLSTPNPPAVNPPAPNPPAPTPTITPAAALETTPSPILPCTTTYPKPSLSFAPPLGGDITLKSHDGHLFIVHSAILKALSSVFADMFTIGTKCEIVELADDAESISLMLQFVYPPTLLSVQTFEQLEKTLRIAQKYDADGILKTLDQSLSRRVDIDFILHDPFRVFSLSSTYDLRSTTAVAATKIHYHLYTREGLLRFTKYFPDAAPIVAIIGTTGIRAKILHNILYDFRSGLPPDLDDDEQDYETLGNLLCTTCYKYLKDWARLAFEELTEKGLDDCDHLFDSSIFLEMKESSDYPTCIDQVSHDGAATFDEWAGNVKLRLQTQLSELDSLCLPC